MNETQTVTRNTSQFKLRDISVSSLEGVGVKRGEFYLIGFRKSSGSHGLNQSNRWQANDLQQSCSEYTVRTGRRLNPACRVKTLVTPCKKPTAKLTMGSF
jgi:hypothetical protein